MLLVPKSVYSYPVHGSGAVSLDSNIFYVAMVYFERDPISSKSEP